MKFESIGAMVDHFGSVTKMYAEIQTAIDRYKLEVTPKTFIRKVLKEQSLKINGVTLKSINDFIEGYDYAISVLQKRA